MSAWRKVHRLESWATPVLMLALQGTALIAAWATWGFEAWNQLPLALLYVLAMWAAAAGITLWIYMAFSLAAGPELAATALRTSAAAMWLMPGALLLASHSQLAVAAGLAAILQSSRVLASGRVPEGQAIRRRRHSGRRSEPLLFGSRAEYGVYFSRETTPAICGALALQTGIYALCWDYPLLAAVSFGSAAAIWSATSVAGGASEPAGAAKSPYSGLRIVVTLLLTATLTAALVRKEVVQESPAAATEAAGTAAMTKRVLQRLAHVPPAPSAPAEAAGDAAKTVVTQVVDAGPAIGAKGANGIPGVVLRPRTKARPKPVLVAPGARLQLGYSAPLAIPFAGEYQLYRESSGSLPAGSAVETGTPLESIYGTTNGGPMDTVAVQRFAPPFDLSGCGKVVAVVTSAEVEPALVWLQLVTERGVEDGGADLLAAKPGAQQTLEFEVPAIGRPLLVREIRILFRRAGPGRNTNVRVAVERLTLTPRQR